jgi:hypothetical protein
MAGKAEKPKKQKPRPKKDDQGVLSALSPTRPERIGSRRADAPQTFGGSEAAQAAASPVEGGTVEAAQAAASPVEAGEVKAARAARPKTSPAKASSTAKPSARAKTAAKKPAAPATRHKAAAPRTFEPTAAAEAAASGTEPTPPQAAPRPSEPRPRPVREGAPGMGTSAAREQPEAESERCGGAGLAGTAIRAAGEITKLGVSVGRRLIERPFKR